MSEESLLGRDYCQTWCVASSTSVKQDAANRENGPWFKGKGEREARDGWHHTEISLSIRLFSTACLSVLTLLYHLYSAFLLSIIASFVFSPR